MSEVRIPLESEMDSVLSFLNQNLRPESQWSIAAEYPNVLNSTNCNNLRIIKEHNQVLAHAAIKYLLIKNVMGIFKVAAIGSVVTDPKYRMQGLSQKIIESCIEAAKSEGADFAVLWTDLYDFYRKMGFELAGTEVSLVIDEEPQIENSNLKFLKSAKISPEAILRLYSQHPCGTIRTADDIRKFLQIPNSQVYTAWSAQNELLAYAVTGKGIDLQGYVHEWGGGVSQLKALLAHVRSDQKRPITLITHPSAQNLVKKISEWPVIKHEGFLGMILPINFDNLFFKIKRYARNQGITDFVLEKTETGFSIGQKNDILNISSVGELTRLLFGPVENNSLTPEFQKVLPVPMWIWGWDSV